MRIYWMVLKKQRNIADMGPKIPQNGSQQRCIWHLFRWSDHQVTTTKHICTQFHDKTLYSSLEIEEHKKIGPKIQKNGPQQGWTWCLKKWIDHQSNIKNICTHFHQKILNGSQEIEEHMPKWSGSREEHDHLKNF